MSAVYGFNIALLVIGPLSTIGLLAWVMLVAKQYSGAFFAFFLLLDC